MDTELKTADSAEKTYKDVFECEFYSRNELLRDLLPMVAECIGQLRTMDGRVEIEKRHVNLEESRAHIFFAQRQLATILGLIADYASGADE